MHDDRLVVPDPSETPALECPECGELAVFTKLTPHEFTYGRGAEAANIKAVLPFRVCNNCGFQYLDKAGQDAQHEAVCRHKGVMTPAQIRALREYHRLKRADFAALTRLGEATIARWERGALIQTAANDLFLRLLGFDENYQRLQAWTGGGKDHPSVPPEPGQQPIFPALDQERRDALHIEKSCFHL
jgi:putative zinc finger/helix-turn-helix YgiT family protein